MWSHLYWYFEMRGSSDYSAKFPVMALVKVFEETGVLEKINIRTYSGKAGFPWINITCYDSADGTYGRIESTSGDSCTMMAIIGSKNDPINEQLYKDLLTDIATRLNWELILESGGENDEDIVLRAITT